MFFRYAERNEPWDPYQYEDWGDEEEPSNQDISLEEVALTIERHTLATLVLTLILTRDANRKGTLIPGGAAKCRHAEEGRLGMIEIGARWMEVLRFSLRVCVWKRRR